MAERAAAASGEKRQLILDAAVRVFARKGYHASRVGDVAEEAGVAHGLLYHYFSSKEQVLETIFRESWSDLVGALRGVEERDEPPREQVRLVAAIVLRTWQRDPDLVRVVVREVTRSPQLQREVAEVALAFQVLESIVARGQQAGDFRAGIDSRLAAYVLYGALEEILTGWVLGQLPDADEDVARAEQAVVDLICDGLLVRDARPRPR